MNIQDIFQNGGLVMWPLLLCSVTVLTVIIERSFFWLSLANNRNRKQMDSLLTFAETGQWEAIKRQTISSKDHIVRLLIVGILHREYDMGRAMEAEADMLLQRMNRFMAVLDTMITIAPLLGIFGTVLGIISSFEMLGTSGIADPKLVTAGIAQALITTATGLGIAITAVIPYNFFHSRINHAIYVMEKYATSLEVVYKKLENKT